MWHLVRSLHLTALLLLLVCSDLYTDRDAFDCQSCFWSLPYSDMDWRSSQVYLGIQKDSFLLIVLPRSSLISVPLLVIGGGCEALWRGGDAWSINSIIIKTDGEFIGSCKSVNDNVFLMAMCINSAVIIIWEKKNPAERLHCQTEWTCLDHQSQSSSSADYDPTAGKGLS